MATQGAADRLGEAGNVIKAGDNAGVAESANQGMALYDKLSGKAGPISLTPDRAAQDLAEGRMQPTSSSEPTAKSATASRPSSISSPEFKASALAELKDWIEKGHCKVADHPNSPPAA